MDFGEVKEGSARVRTAENAFYNPHMEFSRDFSSLAVAALDGALPDGAKLRICDGMSATGIRGIRYAIENRNVEAVTFVDMDKAACELTAENAKANGLQDFAALSSEPEKKSTVQGGADGGRAPIFRVVEDDINHHLYRGGEKFNFVELDPFGSPVPFIRSALLNLRASKHGFLSVTATDTAVLCGAHQKACIINYGARPLHTYFCHEAAVRVLAGHVVQVAAAMHLGIRPLFLLSKRHYVKGIFEVSKSASAAYDSMMRLGYVSFCPKCLAIKTMTKPMLPSICESCGAGGTGADGGSAPIWGGPMWLGELHDKGVLERMQQANSERRYGNRVEIANTLLLMRQEMGMPAFYYDMHAVADHFRAMPKPFDRIVAALQDKGYTVSRTHFNGLAIKTNAPAKDVADAITIQ
ncbi:tRNA (guanine(26)-N(2))-dimethyltransferase [uncultured archaeon]|nr:tRNA (guanine(26)-N(2))-dimethyltransferase [uncultured archaeon]